MIPIVVELSWAILGFVALWCALYFMNLAKDKSAATQISVAIFIAVLLGTDFSAYPSIKALFQ